MRILNSYNKADLFRLTGETDFRALWRAWRSPGFRFLFFFRKVTMYKKYSLRWWLCFPFFRRYFVKYGYQIPISVKIGKGLLMPHFGGVVINSGVVIGQNCNILQNVTLGNTKGGKNPGSPVIGDKVYIGPGALIVGNVKIGNNVMIVGNSFVNMDIPDNSVVIGNPAKIISNKNIIDNYISNEI